jgi:hypothetical protein
MWAVLVQPDSIGIEDEDAVIAERDFFRLPGGFVAVVGVPTGVADPGYSDKFVVIGRDPLLDGLPGRLDGLESLDVEGWIGRWRDIDEALMSLSLHPLGCLKAVYLRCAPVPTSRGVEGKTQFSPAE